MTSTARILELIKKDVTAEFRNFSSTSSVFLFSVTVVFIAIKSIVTWDYALFGAILWILVLFSAINATSKTFDSEGSNQKLFYYALYNPVEIIVAKIIYNTFFIFLIFLLCYGLLIFFTDMSVHESFTYILVSLLASCALSTINSFTSLIAKSTNANNSNLLLSILALPLAIPVLLIMVKITKNINSITEEISIKDDILILSGINLLLVGIVILLIRELWTA
jgi:heme exporter protein B